MTKWQPIETAPRHGELVLCVWPNGEHYQLARYYVGSCGNGDFWFQSQSGGRHLINKTGFTHWMPVPNPPTEKTND